MPNQTSFSEVTAARVPRFSDSRRIKAAKLEAPARISINEPNFLKGAIDMSFAQGLSLEEAVKPLMALRYLSCDVEGTTINFENAIENGFAVAEAEQFAKPHYRSRSLIGLANAVDAAS
jgi:hypothetical protein